MNQSNIKAKLLLALSLTLLLPVVGSYIKWGGLPPGFDLLPRDARTPPGFDMTMFIILSITAVLIWSFVFFPRLFGFKKPEEVEVEATTAVGAKGLPWWFWPGFLVMSASWIVMWGQFESLGNLRFYTFVPLWWGYIFFLDGLLYYRTGGRSFVATWPKLMAICGLLSMPGWYYFEYLNFFVMKNWFYPYLDLLPSPFTYFWSALTFSTVWPSLFIWYQLLNTFKPMTGIYANGPKIACTGKALWWILFSGMFMSVATSIWFDYLFWMIWLGPMLILSAVMGLCGVWTPFHEIKKGNWNPVMLMAIGTTFNSITWEMWNFWSTPNNPNFWEYNLPFVHVLKVFEMPLLGFSGYLFFGPMCWVMWLLCARVLGFSGCLTLPKDEPR